LLMRIIWGRGVLESIPLLCMHGYTVGARSFFSSSAIYRRKCFPPSL
jgi:hypothetical protein